MKRIKECPHLFLMTLEMKETELRFFLTCHYCKQEFKNLIPSNMAKGNNAQKKNVKKPKAKKK